MEFLVGALFVALSFCRMEAFSVIGVEGSFERAVVFDWILDGGSGGIGVNIQKATNFCPMSLSSREGVVVFNPRPVIQILCAIPCCQNVSNWQFNPTVDQLARPHRSRDATILTKVGKIQRFWGCSNREGLGADPRSYSFGGRLAAILPNQGKAVSSYIGRIGGMMQPIHSVVIHKDIGSQFLLRMDIGLCNGILSSGCSPTRVKQGSPDENYAGESDKNLTDPNRKHPTGPLRHILLGLEIALGAVLICSGWLLLIGGIQRAGNAVDVVLDGNRNGWWRVGFWFGMALLGAGLASGVVTYGLSVCAAC